MNARLFPMTRRCRYCGVPLLKGRVCVEHRDCERNDPMYALEALLNTTGSPRCFPAPGRAQEVTS